VKPSNLLVACDLAIDYATRHGRIHAVRSFNLRADEGSMIGIVGESGSGKSTAARGLLGSVQAGGVVVGGSVLIEGRDVLLMRSRERRGYVPQRVGYVPQNPFGALNPIFPIYRQFAHSLKATMRGTKARVRAMELLEAVGIKEARRVLDGYAHELSGGMAQRVVIALAIARDPVLLVADEPTTALDVTVQKQILDLLVGLVSRRGMGLVIVTHDIGVVYHYTTQVVVMNAGNIVERGSVNTVLRNPAHSYTQKLLRSVPSGTAVRGGGVTANRAERPGTIGHTSRTKGQ
jgi:ABC-type glutathione transport system ATPase component